MPSTIALVISLVALAALVCGAGGVLAGIYLERVRTRLRNLQEQIDLLESEIEGIKARRHTQSTTAGVEDALSVAIDIVMQDQAADQYRQARIGQLQKILQTTRQGPYAYPVDQPAGPKPNGGKHGKQASI